MGFKIFKALKIEALNIALDVSHATCHLILPVVRKSSENFVLPSIFVIRKHCTDAAVQ